MNLSQNKIVTMLQFAYCARKLFFGESVIVKMMANKIKVMVLATDVSTTQANKYLSKAEFYNVKVVRLFTKLELASLFNKNEVACVGISDENMAKQIIKLAE